VDKIKVSLKSDKNNRYLTRRSIYIFNNVSFSFSWNDIYFSQTCRENQKHTRLRFSGVFSGVFRGVFSGVFLKKKYRL
jgi:hypothetical protein